MLTQRTRIATAPTALRLSGLLSVLAYLVALSARYLR